MKKILDAKLALRTGLAATKRRPFVELSASELQALFLGCSDKDKVRKGRALIGTGQRWSQKGFKAAQTRWLRALCAKQ
jgi:hypothetical protein